MSKFPELARYEFAFNSKHITKAVEGHEGNAYFYFDHLGELVGKWIIWLIPVGIIISLKSKRIDSTINFALLGALIFVFMFFSIIVKTKIDTYIFFIVPIIYIYISTAVIFFYENYINSKVVKTLFTVAIILLCINPLMIFRYLSPQNTKRNSRIYNANIYKSLGEILPKSVNVVMNMNSFEDIDVMFYNRNVTAYHWNLSKREFDELSLKKVPVAVFEPHGSYTLPEYVLKYPYIFIINKKLADF